ncbi:MAG: HAD-IG family 5'-nucleotidase [Myxococcales bacterium]|nr:HAD-IG family 5'-nucleotidase [Myxococcales bacterium]
MATRDSIQELLPLADLALPLEGQPPRSRRIYCNRNLRLDTIEWLGFDMDYTLAIYNQEAIDRLSIEATAAKLVERGYPGALERMAVPTHFPIRGLLIDKKLGNILKTDRYRYAKKAFHGTREIGSDARKKLYAHKRIRPGTRRYHSIDTLYALSEVAVFAAAVDVLEAGGEKLDYGTLFEDVRACIDEAHRDGTIKGEIVADPGRYLERDRDLPATLHKLRSAGKKLFLLTNSEPSYTESLMEYLFADGLAEYPSWRSYFDVIITDAAKPSFFENGRPFALAAEEEDEGASAADDGSPGGRVQQLERGRVYRQGNQAELSQMLSMRDDRVLYVGDHIYGDVLRAKKQSAWRTLMIIQEMTDELDAMEQSAEEIDRLHRLESRRYALLDGLRDRQVLLKGLERKLAANGLERGERVEVEAARLRLRRAIDRARAQIRAVEGEYNELEERLEQARHPYWGSPFKAESELSAFGEQVERYACLYTDRVTNLLRYSANHYFRGPRHRMAHE